MIKAPAPAAMPVLFKSDEEILAHLGDNARQHRLALNISQDDLATHSGVSRSCVRSFERGDSISTANLARIMRSLRLLQGLHDLIPNPETGAYQRIVGKEKPRLRSNKRSRS